MKLIYFNVEISHFVFEGINRTKRLRMIKYKGITYDVGTEYIPGIFTRDSLEEERVEFDMDAIRNKLNCNSVRIYGKEPERLILAAGIALKYGLEVWLSPRLIDADIENTLTYLEGIASGFELLKQKYPARELDLVVGGELTTDMSSFVHGDSILERIANLLKPAFFIKNSSGIEAGYQKSFDKFLKEAVSTVRKKFSGKVTYASAMWENVDWSDFDFISMNLYKASFNESFHDKILKKLVSGKKPVVITEFGCSSYEGADSKGPTGYSVLDFSKIPPVFREKCVRNEKVQADYIIDLLRTYDKGKVTGAFVFDFYSQRYTYSNDPDKDYDMVSFSITKSLGNNLWEPKESFHRIAEYFKEK